MARQKITSQLRMYFDARNKKELAQKHYQRSVITMDYAFRAYYEEKLSKGLSFEEFCRIRSMYTNSVKAVQAAKKAFKEAQHEFSLAEKNIIKPKNKSSKPRKPVVVIG